MAIGLYFFMLAICLKRDLSIFIRISSYGAISITIISITIIIVGVVALSNTKFSLVFLANDEQRRLDVGEIQTNFREIFMVNTNFSPLAGVLCIGYFLHPVSVSIVRKNKNQENNERDLSMGFVLVFVTYMFIGVFGYFGFMGVYFSAHMLENAGKDPNGPLTQNCIQMFQETDLLGFFLRVVTFLVVFSAFPILHHFFRAGILKIFFESRVGKKRARRVNTASFAEECQRASQQEARSSAGSSSQNRDDGGENLNGYVVGACTFNIVTVFTLLIPLSITVFYP